MNHKCSISPDEASLCPSAAAAILLPTGGVELETVNVCWRQSFMSMLDSCIYRPASILPDVVRSSMASITVSQYCL